MDPIEVRKETVATDTNAGPVAPAAGPAPAERGFPVTQTPAPAAPAVAPVAPPLTAAPAVSPAAATSVRSTRVAVYPAGFRMIQLVWLIAVVVDIILALDFIFRAANAHNTGFAHYIYRLGGWLAAPFNGIFNTTTASNGALIRWTDVLAVVVYTAAAWIVTRLVRITATPRTGINPI
jgi:hypothetical protein